ncbi:hypothetical protein OR16_34283 [Cupriavidus basilensis OR16]|uniref:Uncharacterized protein n=1 Tax=Cupriavidus basilensis OR16 TaxID=1127483 RepID=H1SEW3_9BURK|nr:hypothetical protein OR16_34283 [Cupriavidus basilensis OR16]
MHFGRGCRRRADADQLVAQALLTSTWANAAFEHSAASRAAGTAARNLACIWTISTEIQRTA